MLGINNSMLAVVAALVIGTVGWAAIHLLRASWDYISARGNPRNRAGAHESLLDIGKGVALATGSSLIAAFLVRTLVWG